MSVPHVGHVLIIGAGLGGLALAQGLKRRGISFSVYERDPSPDARAQGYRIKIFPTSVPDLQYLLTPELWQKFETSCAETVMGESALNALDASYIASRALRGPVPYTVDRGLLRKVLLEGLEGDITWGRTFQRYEVHGDQVTAYFSDGSSATGTLLVGADGSRSLVRKQYLPEYRVLDTEGCCLYGKTPLTPELQERISPKLLKWLTLCRDTAPIIQEIIFDNDLPVTMFVEKMHFPHKNVRPDLPDDYVYWSMLVPSRLLGPTEEMLDKTLEQPPHELSLMLTSEWDPSIRCLAELQDPAQAAALRIITTVPDLPRWEPTARVTLLGDSIHVMSPAGGVGAATALQDATTLTKILAKDGLSAASIGEYENAMREYAKVALTRSFRGGRKLFGQPPVEQCKEIFI